MRAVTPNQSNRTEPGPAGVLRLTRPDHVTLGSVAEIVCVDFTCPCVGVSIAAFALTKTARAANVTAGGIANKEEDYEIMYLILDSVDYVRAISFQRQLIFRDIPGYQGQVKSLPQMLLHRHIRRFSQGLTPGVTGLSRKAYSSVSICLDWTPNTNHSGLFAAQELGYFENEGVSVDIVGPDRQEGITPGRRVAKKLDTFAISSSESAVSFATTDGGVRLVAVAALLQGSTSSICTLKESGIESPRDLDGKRYASYDGRFEDAIVAQMVRNDGGTGEVNFHQLEYHGYGDEDIMRQGSVVASYLGSGKSDSTWIFTHVEAVKARRQGVDLNLFKLEDYGIPYGYSPVLLTSCDVLQERGDEIRAFLRALERGHQYCQKNIEDAARILKERANHPSLADLDFVIDSQRSLGDKYLTADGAWGTMTGERWEGWVDFLFQNNIVVDRAGNPLNRNTVRVGNIFSNEFLPKAT